MRILFLSQKSPLPANNGSKMRTWALLRALAAEGHLITLLASSGGHKIENEGAVLREVCETVELIGIDHAAPSQGMINLRRVKNLFSRLPHSVQAFRSRAMSERIALLVKSQSFDAVLCEETEPLVNLPSTLPMPLIVDNHNVEHLIFQRYAALERNPANRVYARLESRKVRNWEQRSCRRAAMAAACSEYDRSVLQRLCPGTPIFVLPNVVDVDDYHPADTEEPRKVLYQGGMDWYPNRDAVEFFATAILPILRKLISDVRFVVAGRNPSDEFRQRISAISGIEFTGTVPDMRTEIADAAVCVVPLRIGSGTRLKILEGAAMAKPIVSTSLGAEGLNLVDGKEILLADEPEKFARSIARLLQDEALRRSLGQAARRRIEDQYSFSALRAAVRRAISAMQEKTSTKESHNELHSFANEGP